MNRLEISELQIIPIKPKNGLLAFCSFIINNQFYIGSVAIYARLNGAYRLVYPSKSLPNGYKTSCVHPISKETGRIVEQAVVKSFKDLMKKLRESEDSYEFRERQ